ncbi:MAG: TIGR04053 family radical SAM/SPASM domain-containing protein [Planctomycetes bacterium]|nr:TIGR04053 family radical SAM/SPASM domain-containing protein [Planctomycetota bacterium]
MRPVVDFNHAPFIVIWEVTRACDLACRHCRAEAQPTPDAQELTTAEGLRLLSRVREEFGPVLFVLTGGDPLKRADLHELIRHGTAIGLRMTITPSVTPLLTSQSLGELHASGIRRVAMSLDGADAQTHDHFRGVEGTFRRTLWALETARNLGMEIQINSTISRHNLTQVEQLAKTVSWLDATLWSVFILVPTGRAVGDAEAVVPSAAKHELLYRRLANIALDPTTTFDVKTTAGQPYYRVLAQERARRGVAVATRSLRAPRGVNDGNGFCFISHTGDICPSGFLPLAAGNVRTHDVATVYRHHELFTRLRQPHTFSGKCGVCEFNDRCGGSRSRTYGLTGDPFASDPTCVYQPKVAIVPG